MKKFVFIVLSVFLAHNVGAEKTVSHTTKFGECSFKKIEKDFDGLFVFFNCGNLGTKKCYVQKDTKGYGSLAEGALWKSFDTKKIVVSQSDDNGKQTITKHDNGKLDGWFTGDCKTFYTKKAAFDVKNDRILLAIEDKIDLPFVDHPEVIGTWRSVDFVEKEKEFEPNKKRFEDDLFFKGIKFSKKGKTDKPFWIWTKGILIHKGDKTASVYEIKNIDNKDYLFLEWKTGDYVYRHEKPRYYVLEKVVKVNLQPKIAKKK